MKLAVMHLWNSFFTYYTTVRGLILLYINIYNYPAGLEFLVLHVHHLFQDYQLHLAALLDHQGQELLSLLVDPVPQFHQLAHQDLVLLVCLALLAHLCVLDYRWALFLLVHRANLALQVPLESHLNHFPLLHLEAHLLLWDHFSLVIHLHQDFQVLPGLH